MLILVLLITAPNKQNYILFTIIRKTISHTYSNTFKMGDSYESLSKTEAEQMAELEAEFQRELERNAMAVRLLQEKAEEAKNAKLRYV